MKKTLPLLIAIIFAATTIYSCKLDPPVLPGDKGYVQQYPPTSGAIGSSGSTGATGTTGNSVNDTNLTGTWMVIACYTGGYANGQTLFGSASANNLLDGVTLNDAAKTAVFTGLNTLYLNAPTQTYTLAKSGSTEYITFSEDPLNRSSNDKIQVTALTSSSMTWVGIDPQETAGVNGVQMQAAYKIVFSK